MPIQPAEPPTGSGDRLGVVPLKGKYEHPAQGEAGADSYLAAVLSVSDEAIIGLTLEGRISNWNAGAEKIFGYSAAQVQGRLAGVLAPDDIVDRENEILAGVLRGNGLARYETVRLRRDGERVTVALSIVPLRDHAGAILGAVLVAQDITAQKKAAAVAAQLRVAIDAAPNGIVMIDQQGRIIMVNTQMERLFGYERRELMGQSIEQLIPRRFRGSHPGQRDAYFAAPEVRAMGHGRDLYARRKDGSEFPVEVGLNPAHTAEGTYVVGAIIDIGMRKRMEAELARAHSDLQERASGLEAIIADRTAHLQRTIAELESVSYSLSHDLRGPLRTIQGFAQIVLEDAGERLNDEERDLLAKAIRAAHRLDRLIQDVLTYTRVSRQLVSIETVDVENLLRQIIDERPAFQSPQAEIEILSPLHPVQGHEASLTQVITNLLDNAVKFVPEDRKPRIRVRSTDLGERVDLWFEDNGIGIPPEAQPRLFSIFQRVHDDKKYPGTGIGLAIVHKAVERMGGSVRFDSEVGAGTRFCVNLPKGAPA